MTLILIDHHYQNSWCCRCYERDTCRGMWKEPRWRVLTHHSAHFPMTTCESSQMSMLMIPLVFIDPTKHTFHPWLKSASFHCSTDVKRHGSNPIDEGGHTSGMRIRHPEIHWNQTTSCLIDILESQYPNHQRLQIIFTTTAWSGQITWSLGLLVLDLQEGQVPHPQEWKIIAYTGESCSHLHIGHTHPTRLPNGRCLPQPDEYRSERPFTHRAIGRVELVGLRHQGINSI
jgi:hypothetical protein